MTRMVLSALLLGVLALALLAGAAPARAQAWSTEELVRVLKPAEPAVPTLGGTRGFTPATGGRSEPQPPPGTAGSGVVPDLKILFPFGSAELTVEARGQLDRLAAALASAELRPFRFTIAGHTDAVGSDAYNEGLSARRARAVVDYLSARHGIERARLEALGLGERELAVPAEPGSALNRRVEVRTRR